MGQETMSAHASGRAWWGNTGPGQCGGRSARSHSVRTRERGHRHHPGVRTWPWSRCWKPSPTSSPGAGLGTAWALEAEFIETEGTEGIRRHCAPYGRPYRARSGLSRYCSTSHRQAASTKAVIASLSSVSPFGWVARG